MLPDRKFRKGHLNVTNYCGTKNVLAKPKLKKRIREGCK